MFSNSKRMFLILAFIFLFLLTRLPRLHNDILSTDAVYWHDRSEKFMTALSEKDFAETYQMYHPGVTLMWLTGGTAKIISQIEGTSLKEVFSNPSYIHHKAKLVLVFWQLLLTLLIIKLLAAEIGFNKAFPATALFSFEPFFVGNSRLLHLDGQITLYVLLGLLLVYSSFRNFKLWKVFLAAFFLTLALLSKTLFLGAILFAIFVGGYIAFKTLKTADFKKYISLLVLGSAALYFLFFPAYWNEPFATMSTIFVDSLQVGNDAGHKQIFFGEVTRNPGPLFYPIVFALKLSAVTSLGFLIYLVSKTRAYLKLKIKKLDLKTISFISFAGIFYLGYFLILTYFSKKVDRYFIILIPYLSILAVLGYCEIKMKAKNLILSILVVFTLVYPLFTAFPHYLTYINPVFGNAKDGNEILGQKLFGIGIFELQDHLKDKYGENVKVAINDPAPLTLIHGSDNVFNISVEHPNSYRIFVLGPNKVFPPSVVNSGVRFKQRDSVYINGLEFWRVFEKI